MPAPPTGKNACPTDRQECLPHRQARVRAHQTVSPLESDAGPPGGHRMTAATPSFAPATSLAPAVTGYVGEVVYLYAFDVAYEMHRKPTGTLLGQPLVEFQVGTSKRSPRQLSFYRPPMVRLPPVERIGPRGTLRVERSVKLLSVGAISITVRVPFRVNTLGELVAFHDLRFSDGTYLYDEV